MLQSCERGAKGRRTRVGVEVVVFAQPSVEQALLQPQRFVESIVVSDRPAVGVQLLGVDAFERVGSG